MQEFLEDVWISQPSPGWGFISVKDDVVWRDIPVEVIGGSFDMPELPEEVDLYFTPNLFSRALRRQEFVLPSSWLYADLDGVDPHVLPEGLTPSVAWETSPHRYQAMWWVRGQLEPEAHSSVNKQLTYRVGADRSGWHCTKVLRIPETTNYKYPSRPQGRMLWDSLRNVRIDPQQIKSRVRPVAPVAQSRELPLGVQMKLLAKVATGDRSKVLWRLEHQLLECGYTPDQVFWALRGTVWNKWGPDDDKLRAEIERAQNG